MHPLFIQAQSEVSIAKKLSVIKTEYFDFIFPEASEPTAKHLAQHADTIYEKASLFLNTKPTMRLPVVVTPETDALNAYFSPFPYNRIVVYDTVPPESLAVFSDALLSVFYHEVIHAISLNMKSPNWDNKSGVYTDILSPFMILNMPPSFSEGTAVLAESMDGKGRLNSAYAVHVIRQAKIEDKFPDWRDIAGSYDLYTDGSLPYIFGGAFSNYLYQKYGMEKFADFWNQCSNFHFTVYPGAFKKVYKLSLDEVWQEFEDSIYVPPLALHPQPLFSQESPFWRDTSSGAYLYLNLTSSPEGIAWQDGFSGTVRFLPHDSEKQKIKTLYATDLTGRLHFSRDGKYLVSSGFTEGKKAKNTVRVYDMEHKKFILTQKGLRDGMILTIPEDANVSLDSPLKGVSSVLAGIQTDAALASLVLHDMDVLQPRGYDSKPLVSIPFKRNIFLFEPVDAGNGLIIALMKNLGTWQFFVYNYITGTQRIYTINQPSLSPSVISDLYISDTMLYMSYAQTATSQPVLAYVSLEDFNGDTLSLQVQTEQVSGGIFNPVVIPDAEQKENIQIAYISRYYEDRALSLLPMESDDLFETLTFITYIAPDTASEAPIDYPIEAYRATDYMKGLFIPILGSLNLNPFTDYLPQSFSVGASAYTMDPAGRFLIMGGAGMDVCKNQLTAAFSTMFNENYFTATADVFAAFSLEQIETFAGKLYTDFTIPLVSNFNRIKLANEITYFYLAEENEYLFDGHTLHDTIEVSFSHLRPTGQFFYDRVGFTIGTQVLLRKQFSQNKSASDDINIGHAFFLGLQTPRLLPFKNPERFTINLPATIFGYRYFNFTKMWALESNVVLFAYDLQKPIWFFPSIFVKRLTLDAGLDCEWYASGEPEMTVHGSLFGTFSSNTGLTTGVPIDVGVAFTWKPHVDGIDGLRVNLKLDLNL